MANFRIDGSPAWALDLRSGEIVQLTDAGPVRAEYWPFTEAVRGAGACLATIGSGGRDVFYFEGTELCSVEIEALRVRRLLSLPQDRGPSILNADDEGKTLVFATWDESLFMARSQKAYAGEQFADDRIFQEMTSTTVRLDAVTGRADEVLRRQRFWINHVLVNPLDRDLILFCHEWSGMPDRMWLLNAGTGECAPIPGQGPDEWYIHESWSADGRRVCFHGGRQRNEAHGFCI